jgi:uncharacterized protein YecT (DUF1311 family)
MLKKIIISSMMIFFSISTAFALSTADYEKLLKTSPVIKKADAELNDIWKRVFKPLTGDYRKQILNDQRNWVKFERESDAQEFMQSGMSKEKAYEQAIKKRINRLRVVEYNSNLSEEDAAAGRARADDFYNSSEE